MSATIAEVHEEQKPREKKKVVRRSAPDVSQRVRRGVQLAFVALNTWIGAQFFLWARQFTAAGLRGAGQGFAVSRPAGVEGWLPIAGLMNLKYFAMTGRVTAIHPAAMFLLMAFLLMSLVLKKAFCSWLCPVGTLSEYLWKLGRKMFGRNFAAPRWLDLGLRSQKYILLGLFVAVIGYMSAEALHDFMAGPYGIIADVKMLDFFRGITWVGLTVLVALGGLSLFIQNFWCRYLCPYGALMGLVSLGSPVKVRRDQDACIDCGKCAKACPARLKVDELVQIRSVECSACLACVAACPVENGLQFALPPARTPEIAERWLGRRVSPRAVVAALAAIFFGVVLYARMSGHWQTVVPNAVYQQLVPHADAVSHPM